MDKNLKEKLLSLPTMSGVYLMKDSLNNIIYVGKAKNLKRRVNSYFVDTDKPIKTMTLVSNIADFDYIVTASDTDAFLLENNLIKKYQPRFNILLKDGKNYPYIKINLKEDFPRLEVTRKVKKDGYKYFGPYFNGISPTEILKIISRAFSIRNCSHKITETSKEIRPCLNYSLGLCSAPCAKYISKEDYKNQILEVVDFLKGNTKKVEEILRQKMELASENQNYEKAIEIRGEIKSLNNLKMRYTSQFPKIFSQDIVAFYSTGTKAVFTVMIIRDGKLMGIENFALNVLQSFEDSIVEFMSQYYAERYIPKKIVLQKDFEDIEELSNLLNNLSGEKVEIIVAQKGQNKKLVDLALINGKEYLEKSIGLIKTKEMKTVGAIKRLQEVLRLKDLQYRMECYDISHISGTNSVGSMVVFENGQPAKKQYRKFAIKTIDGNNDFASLQEVLTRRIAELKKSTDGSFSVTPNLIIIDGGKGQLSSVSDIFRGLNVDIPLCSLAKQDEEIYVLDSQQPIRLSKNDVALQVLQRIRDEAHRFAITFHRSKRKKTMTKSALDDIKGIGKSKKQQLFEKFGSIDAIKNASVDELMLISGITQNLATEILKTLNNK